MITLDVEELIARRDNSKNKELGSVKFEIEDFPDSKPSPTNPYWDKNDDILETQTP